MNYCQLLSTTIVVDDAVHHVCIFLMEHVPSSQFYLSLSRSHSPALASHIGHMVVVWSVAWHPDS